MDRGAGAAGRRGAVAVTRTRPDALPLPIGADAVERSTGRNSTIPVHARLRTWLVRLLHQLHLYNAAKWILSRPPVLLVRDLVATRAYPADHRARIQCFYAAFVRPGDLCFDVGANVGHRVDVLVALGARVVAVEPQRRCLRVLRLRFGRNPTVTIAPYGLDDHEGTALLHNSEAHTISSLSTGWIEAVRQSGRFSSYFWKETEQIQLTTLDKLIDQHGVPRFCKIDVEGFELHVLRGLSRPIDYLCFEFIPELIDVTIACVKHLSMLAPYEFNYSIGESMEFSLDEWLGPEEMQRLLQNLDGYPNWGDVYARVRRDGQGDAS